ncbi:hypothetical protein [Hyphococcus sp.]|uniref:hypothetical protein n=1 Tax=Hyphococcus sp. TaxID=2038636 RepID=UPI0035C73106
MNAGMIAKTPIAYLLSLAATYVLSVGFYTQQVIAKMAAVGAEYSGQQKIDTFVENLTGLAYSEAGPSFLLILTVTLAIAYIVAFVVKRIIKPLASVAYPIAGAAGLVAVLMLVESSVAGGGAGVFGGARDITGLALQALAGFLGGAVFTFARPR